MNSLSLSLSLSVLWVYCSLRAMNDDCLSTAGNWWSTDCSNARCHPTQPYADFGGRFVEIIGVIVYNRGKRCIDKKQHEENKNKQTNKCCGY